MTPFEQGYQTPLARDNPYWKNYPNKTADLDRISASQWIDGWVAKAIEEKQNENNSRI